MIPLLSSKSLWCLLCGSVEERHIDDIIFAVRCLLRVGISPSQILIFADAPVPLVAARLKPYVQDVALLPVRPTTALAQTLHDHQGYSLLIVATTGHGSPGGISANPNIPQRMLFDAIRKYPQEAHAVIILGQCYAGSFNLYHGPSKPCVIGATNLNPSASLPSKPAECFRTWPQDFIVSAWDANVFLLNLFGWLVCPVDTDGDGILSLLDAYKFAGIQAHEQLRRAKARLALRLTEISSRYEKLSKAPVKQLTKKERLFVEQETRRLEEQVSTLFLHQEAWIDNDALADGIGLVECA